MSPGRSTRNHLPAATSPLGFARAGHSSLVSRPCSIGSTSCAALSITDVGESGRPHECGRVAPPAFSPTCFASFSLLVTCHYIRRPPRRHPAPREESRPARPWDFAISGLRFPKSASCFIFSLKPPDNRSGGVWAAGQMKSCRPVPFRSSGLCPCSSLVTALRQFANSAN